MHPISTALQLIQGIHNEKTLEGEHYKEALGGGVVIRGCKLTNLWYVDVTTLITSKVEEIETLLRKLDAVGWEYGLEINQSKTKMMIADSSNNNRLEMTEIPEVEFVDYFIYLDSDVNNKAHKLENFLIIFP